MRGRREREERQKELVQRQRKILQANLRSQQQRWRDSDQQARHTLSVPCHQEVVSIITIYPINTLFTSINKPLNFQHLLYQ